MKHRGFVGFFFIAVSLLCAAVARAEGPLPAPKLVQGQYVYTIPEWFQPPLMGPNGLKEIQTVLAAMHYPYYVVLVDRLPGSGDGDQLAAQAINGLAQDWADKSPIYDVSKASIFVLSYEPKKYRFLAGAAWKTNLGFEQGAHKPYTDIFLRSMKGTPQDPKRGIIDMAKAVDDMLFDRTDPARVAARAEADRRANEEARIAFERRRVADEEAARLAAVARELQVARGGLSAQATRLQQLLGEKEYLPEDVSAYRQTLNLARAALDQNDAAKMRELVASAKMNADTLQNYVAARADEASAARLRNGLILGFFALLVVVAGVLIRSRRKKLNQLLEDFNEVFAEWEQKLGHATTRYATFNISDRDQLGNLTNLSGATAALFTQVTTEVDEIYTAVRAMSDHLTRCRVVAATASFFNSKPLERARVMLEGAFDFDTEAINATELFAKETRVIRGTLQKFAQDLEARFKTSIAGWNRLVDVSAKKDVQTAEQAFPASVYNTMKEQAEEYGIPVRWLASHPLAGDTVAVYTELNRLRRSDPIAYDTRLSLLYEKQSAAHQAFELMVVALAEADAARVENVPTFGTSVSDADNPNTTLAQARRAEAEMAGLLASSDSVDEIVAQATSAQILFGRVRKQIATIQYAIEQAAGAIKRATEAGALARSRQTAAGERIASAQRVHANVRVDGYLTNGKSDLVSGDAQVEEAKHLLQENRHLDAQRTADLAQGHFVNAEEDFSNAIQCCNDLDRKKIEYEQMLARMDEQRIAAQSRMQHYGRPRTFDVYVAPSYGNTSLDYALMNAELIARQAMWDREAREAQDAYEEEQRRIRQEEQRRADEERRAREEEERQAREETRRRQQAEDDRRRASSYDSPSSNHDSSSGSSWSSTDSSSGGGFSGGGDSSSGGSW